MTGTVAVSWNDTRLDPTHLASYVFATESTNGRGYNANVRVTTAPTDERAPGADAGNQYGDYEGLDAYAGHIHPVWTDRRPGLPNRLDEEVFSARLLE
ncbi:MAG: hypothetical protein ACR2KL_05660 [Nocardioidaceae bacterium]